MEEINAAPVKKCKKGSNSQRVDEELLRKLARIMCTHGEIAAVLGVSKQTIANRWADVVREEQEVGKSSLRRAQWVKAVEELHPTMLIWMGKQFLGQSDKNELAVDDKRTMADVCKDLAGALGDRAKVLNGN